MARDWRHAAKVARDQEAMRRRAKKRGEHKLDRRILRHAGAKAQSKVALALEGVRRERMQAPRKRGTKWGYHSARAKETRDIIRNGMPF